MKVVCKKCGKAVTVTNSELVALKGSIVCPQCLNVTKVPYQKPAPSRQTRSTACPHCGAATRPSDAFCLSCGRPLTRSAATPPPRRKAQAAPKINFSELDQNTPPRPPRTNRKAGKKKNEKQSSSLLTMSPFGCLWRSVVITIVLLLLYSLLGKLIEI